ncbi:MAG: WecB/TagA/CpsF family glycosyltransferase [Patescibacteria group bacterium]
MPSIRKNQPVILGVGIANLDLEQSVDKIRSFLISGRKHTIFTPNPEICHAASKNDHYRKILNSSSLNIADGFGLKIGGLILGQKVLHRVTGIDLTWRIIDLAAANHYKIMLLGGMGDTARLAADKIKEQYPNIEIVGAASGIEIQIEHGRIVYNIEQNQKLTKLINRAAPDILLVAFGAPKQESWIFENIGKLNSIRLAVGVGGTLDFIAGNAKRAPQWLRKIGCEWLYRLIKEPRRWRRIFAAIVLFPATCIKWRWRWLYKYRPNIASIIYNCQNQILLIFNPRFHYWTLPQGGIGPGENIPVASLREIREEIGMDSNDLEFIKIIPSVYSYDWPREFRNFRPYKGQRQKFICWRFTKPAQYFHFKKSDEVAGVKWVGKDELLSALPKVRRESIKKIFSYL